MEKSIIEGDRDNAIVAIDAGDGTAIFAFQEPVFKPHELEVLLTMNYAVPGVEAFPLQSRVNLFSSSSKQTFVRTVVNTYGKDVQWDGILQKACGLYIKACESYLEREVRTPYENMEETPTTYLLQPFIQKNGINLFFGARDSCKTYLTIRMIMSLASGLPFLFETPKERVRTLFLDYEADAGTFQNRVRRLGEGTKGWKPEYARENIRYVRINDQSLSHITASLKSIIRKEQIGLIVIDSCAKANDAAIEESRTANAFSRTLDRIGVTSLIIGHVRKGDKEQEDIFGSSFYMNDARNAWNAQKTSEEESPHVDIGLFHRKSNNDRRHGAKSVEIIFQGDDGPVIVQKGTKPVGANSLRALILDELRTGPKKVKELSEQAGASPNAIRARLGQLKGKYVIKNADGTWEKFLGKDAPPPLQDHDLPSF